MNIHSLENRKRILIFGDKQMKKLFIAAAILLTLTISAAADSDAPSYVTDDAGVLSEGSERYMNTLSATLKKACGGAVYVVTKHDSGDMTANQYAEKLYKEMSVDSSGRSNSVLIYVSIADKDYSIQTSDGISASLTGEYVQKCLFEHMEPDFSKKKYNAAVVKTYNSIAKWYNDSYSNVELKLTDDMQQYDDIVSSEHEQAQRRRTNRTLTVVTVIIVSAVALLYTRRKIRLKKLREKRKKRRLRYLDIDNRL